MNIHNNRYVIFIAPMLWCLTAMLASKSYYNIMLSIIFIFQNLVNLIVISHKKFLNFTPHQILYYYTYIVKQNIVQTVICIFGFTDYAFLGSFIIFFDPYKISLLAGTCWVIFYIVSFVYTMFYMEWWGILLILWGFIRHLCYDHINKISIEKRFITVPNKDEIFVTIKEPNNSKKELRLKKISNLKYLAEYIFPSDLQARNRNGNTSTGVNQGLLYHKKSIQFLMYLFLSNFL